MLRAANNKGRASPAAAGRTPRKPPVAAAAAAVTEDVVIDVINLEDAEGAADLDEEPAPPPPRKNVYNPHRILYIIVWLNFVLLLLQGALFATYVLTRPSPMMQQQQQQQQRQPPQERTVVHRSMLFTFDSETHETTLQLPNGQFDAQRLVDMTVCCTDIPPDNALQCTQEGIHMSGNDGVVRISSPTLAAASGACRFSWSQQR